MQISEAAGGAPAPGAEPCRFPKLEECAHFHYERVQLPKLTITLQTNIEQSLHSQHSNNDDDDIEWFMIQATSGDECWLLQRNIENFKMLDAQLHQCIYDRKISKLPDLSNLPITQENYNNTKEQQDDDIQDKLTAYLERFSDIADNTINCGPILNWLQMDNKGHRLLVPSEESRSINTPAVAAAYSVRRYVSQARDELNLEVGDMISVIDMANPGESMWWRGKRGFQVGFFPQYCVHIIGDKVPRNMPLPPPVVGSLALTPIKPVLRKHGKLITFFRSFLLNRPSRRRLKQSGILRERVFGCDLGEHLLNTSNDIPMVLKYCSEFIEKYGIVDGIYRLSGITSNIQKLRNTFDEERIPNLYTDDILQDIHSVASLLKMYFRELPNPLCTYQLYQSFVNAVQGCHQGVRNTENDHERLLKMRETVQKLPPPHYRTLEYLMRHLARVAKHGHSTGMTTRNIAIVWAPNLLRSAELEIGGVAALQGVGVQAVVTEFLICYADLIFCDHLPNLSTTTTTNQLSSLSPKKTCCRPKSLAISTPAKLITLEEARNKHLLGQKEDNYIEVGGGPKNLPKKYHTVIELRKRTTSTGSSNERNTSTTTTTKRSPLGWRSLFTKRNNNTTTNNENDDKNKNRKASTPGCGSGSGISGSDLNDHKIVDIDLIDMKRKLRTVKSAESLTSTNLQYHENTVTTKIDEIDNLGPLYTLNNNRNGHNRSVSHDSYFDTIQQSQNNSLLDLSEIQLNFELEESEMRIFSEDESLVSSPRLQQHQQQQSQQKRLLLTTHPSPKKQARIVVSSPDQQSRKRTRLEDQLSDIQFIDCTTPDLTIALIHDGGDNQENKSEEPCNKSPRNSLSFYNTKRQSLNLDTNNDKYTTKLTKSLTDNNLNCKLIELSSCLTTPTTTTPQSVCYKQLSSNSDDDDDDDDGGSPTISQTNRNYENILTTISITYKSPRKLKVETLPSSPRDDDYEKHANLYENVVVNVEKAIVPTSTASLPFQEATQPIVVLDDERPKSLSALDDVVLTSTTTTKTTTDQTVVCCLSSDAVCDYNEKNSMPTINDLSLSSSSSIQSSLTNIQYTPSVISDGNLIDNDNSSVVDLMTAASTITTTNDLVGNNSDTSHGSSLNCCRLSLSKESSPRVSPGLFCNSNSSDDIVGNVKNLSCNSLINDVDDDDDNDRSKVDDLIEFSPTEPPPPTQSLITDTLQPEISSQDDDNSIYQQVKFFRRSIHEVNALLELPPTTTTTTTEGTSSSSSSDTTITDGATNTTTTITLSTNKQNQQILNSDHHLIEDENYDSLESDNMHVYENMNSDDMRKSPIIRQVTPSTYENVEITTEKIEDEHHHHQVCVKDLKSKFEDITTAITTTTTTNDERKLKKYINYDKDGLPPCLRARNLKYQFKTRSLDEEEFKKELITNNHTNNTNTSVKQRRKSFDENLSYKTNSLPKRLNPPKCLPLEDENFQLNKIIHLAHSTENLTNLTTTATTNCDLIEQQKKRERIEKYKEERRKFLHDKYRSESFKEDKDVLLSQLKLFRNKDDDSDQKYYQQQQQQERRKSTNIGDDHSDDSLKVKAMIFEQHNKVVDDDHVVVVVDDDHHHHVEEQQHHHQRAVVELRNNRLLLKTTDLLQTKNNSNNLSNSSGNNNNNHNNHNNHHHIHNNSRMDERIEKRRHTYENRERETEMERLRRISLENSRSPRREKPPQTVNIKDMKAIFESKSKQ